MRGHLLTALKVGNFKAFDDIQTIPIKPITLIFGPNSAGKSSFIHSLALAHEAQFGRDRSPAKASHLEIYHTSIGGTAIDLGGFRQYVHRGEVHRRVHWGAELDAAGFHGQLAQLLAPVESIAISIAIGIELDDQDHPRPGAEPLVESVEILADSMELLRMSRRRADSQAGILRVDRLAANHPVFRQVLKAIIEGATTSLAARPQDFETAAGVVGEFVPQLHVRIESFFPIGVEFPRSSQVSVPFIRGDDMRPDANLAPTDILFPVSRGNRPDDLAQAVRFYFPRTLDDLVRALFEALASDLQKLHYLGPLRSFPPRHLGFAEYEDANWFAGGGYAWDIVRRDDTVREAVNAWLGSEALKTPYRLMVRSLIALDQMQGQVASSFERLQDEGLDMEPDYDDESGQPDDMYPIIKDIEAQARHLVSDLESSDIDRVKELVLVDQRTKTVVTHRDVGIGISQVLPVLVLAYGSDNKIIAMEQPEIHLHPALQAELGDVFIEAATGTRRNTFILETHSEHLILRLLRRIRETGSNELPLGKLPLKPEDLAVVYIQPDQAGSRVIEIPVTAEGDFASRWPDGFFAERAKELF